MRTLLVALGIVSMSLFATGCSEEDREAASESLKEAASKAGDAIEDTASGLGKQMEEGKQRIRDAADEIENE